MVSSDLSSALFVCFAANIDTALICLEISE
jgi:hypothetical protein